MKPIIILAIAAVFLYWFFILRPGRLDFWKIAGKNPNAAYDHFMSNDCWMVFENDVPDDYRNIVPKDAWTGPFRICIPKLGNKMVHVFGKHPEFEHSQNVFLSQFTENT